MESKTESINSIFLSFQLNFHFPVSSHSFDIIIESIVGLTYKVLIIELQKKSSLDAELKHMSKLIKRYVIPIFPLIRQVQHSLKNIGNSAFDDIE